MDKLKVITGLTGNFKCEPTDVIFGLNEALNIYTRHKCLVAIGADHMYLSDIVRPFVDYYKIYFMPEEPNGYTHPNVYQAILAVEANFNLIIGQCKYTNVWREKYFNSPKRLYTFTPFDERYIFPSENKEFDVYWTGTSKPGTFIEEIQAVVRNFSNHCIVNFRTTGEISHNEKMVRNGKSKISVTYGLLFVPNETGHIRSIPDWDKNEAFSHLDSGLLPQMKTRVYEAAFSKSVILHKRDQWNVIEDFFEPEKEFIYYDGIEDLREKINEILKNYGDYYYIAENAYNRAINNYTTSHFIEKYIPNTEKQ